MNRKKKEKEKPPRAGYEYNFKWNCSERQPFCWNSKHILSQRSLFSHLIKDYPGCSEIPHNFCNFPYKEKLTDWQTSLLSGSQP